MQFNASTSTYPYRYWSLTGAFVPVHTHIGVYVGSSQ